MLMGQHTERLLHFIQRCAWVNAENSVIIWEHALPPLVLSTSNHQASSRYLKKVLPCARCGPGRNAGQGLPVNLNEYSGAVILAASFVSQRDQPRGPRCRGRAIAGPRQEVSHGGFRHSI